MKTTKRLSTVLAILLVFILLAACANNTNNASNANDTASNATAPPAESEGAGSTEQPNESDLTLPLKETATIKLMTVVTDGFPASNEILLWQDIEQETNVKVDWQDIALSQWPERKGLVFASNDLPEAFIGHGMFTDSDLLNYGATGQLIPLEDLIEKYSPNLMKAFEEFPELRSEITAPDGHIYGIPSFLGDRQSVRVNSPIFVNKAWLEKVDMEIPTTTDEFEQLLIAFKADLNENGKKDEIPLLLHTNSGYFSNLFGAFGLIDQYGAGAVNHIWVEDGKIIYSLAQPEYKEAIQYFHRLYEQGLIDVETFTQDRNAYNAKLKTVPRTVGVMQTWRATSWANNDAEVEDYIAIPPLAGPNGDSLFVEYAYGLNSRGSFAITNAAQNPELIMRWIDHVISDDIQMQMANGGRYGDYLEKGADGKVKLLRALDPNNPAEQFNNPSNSSRINFMTYSNSERLVDETAVYKQKSEYDKLYIDHFPKEVLPKLFFSQEESQQIATMGSDINPYADGLYAKWIMEGGIEEEWDDYLKTLNKMGLEQFLAVYQGALDRYNSAK